MSDKVKSSAEMWDNRFAGEKFAYGKEPMYGLQNAFLNLPSCKKQSIDSSSGEEEMQFGARLGWNAEVFDLSAQGKSSVKCLLQNTVLALTTMLRT